ncbi:MAG: glycine zipper 2TM domain-containing protein [Pseudomonadales bacterium]|nr:glycine zipper 2TM domain-containing protein [Pseudomonadales bacterium]
MDKSMIKGLVIGAVIATAGGAVAGYNMIGGGFAPPPPTHAEVLNVVPATRTVSVPREVCEEVPVTRQKPVKDEHQVIGTVAGAVIGGVLGNQVGGGSGKKVATVAGAAAGGYAGNKIQERVQENNTYTAMETRCNTVSDSKEEVIGYDVTYRIGDQQGQVRMDRDPGAEIPLVDGELALN